MEIKVTPDALTTLMETSAELGTLSPSYRDGVLTLNGTPSKELKALLENGPPQEDVDATIARGVAQVRVEKVREKINQEVGDTASILGTVSDATGVLVAVALADVVALSTSANFDDYRTAKLSALKALAGDADIAAIAGEAISKIQSGEVVLTASLKGLESVIDETLIRSTTVANVLESV